LTEINFPHFEYKFDVVKNEHLVWANTNGNNHMDCLNAFNKKKIQWTKISLYDHYNDENNTMTNPFLNSRTSLTSLSILSENPSPSVITEIINFMENCTNLIHFETHCRPNIDNKNAENIFKSLRNIITLNIIGDNDRIALLIDSLCYMPKLETIRIILRYSGTVGHRKETSGEYLHDKWHELLLGALAIGRNGVNFSCIWIKDGSEFRQN
jgi:hypothetical protein